jgi:hypothetical protein
MIAAFGKSQIGVKDIVDDAQAREKKEERASEREPMMTHVRCNEGEQKPRQKKREVRGTLGEGKMAQIPPRNSANARVT